MKIYIIGSVASGKTTLAKELTDILGIKCIHLDGIVHKKDVNNKKWGNIRRSDEDIDLRFNEILNQESWIIEDAGRPIFNMGLINADCIIYLKPPSLVRKRRIITRYIKQKFALEFSLYTPSLRMVKFMYKCTNDYESGRDNLENRLRLHKDKVHLIKNSRDKKIFIKTLEFDNDN